MIEICTTGAQLVVERIKRYTASPAGVFLQAALQGIVGVILLQGFFALAISSTAMITLLPGIIAFNAATCGYSLVDKRDTAFPWKKMGLACIAAILTITAAVATVLFCPWESLADAGRLFTSGCIAMTFVYLGSWLAAKNKKLIQENSLIQKEEVPSQ